MREARCWVDPAVVTREWIEQVIDSRVHPRVRDLHIQPVETAPGRAAYVLTIPQASADAPHQAPDNKYYYRQNFQSVPMEDYQVRDAMRRATTPELFVRLSFESEQTELALKLGAYQSVQLYALLGNRSSQPAFHAVIQLGIDEALPVVTIGSFEGVGHKTDENGRKQSWFLRRIASPPGLPVFKEDLISPHRYFLAFECPTDYLSGEWLFYITTTVQTPGYASTERWVIHHRANILRLREPGHFMTR